MSTPLKELFIRLRCEVQASFALRPDEELPTEDVSIGEATDGKIAKREQLAKPYLWLIDTIEIAMLGQGEEAIEAQKYICELWHKENVAGHVAGEDNAKFVKDVWECLASSLFQMRFIDPKKDSERFNNEAKRFQERLRVLVEAKKSPRRYEVPKLDICKDVLNPSKRAWLSRLCCSIQINSIHSTFNDHVRKFPTKKEQFSKKRFLDT